MSQRRLYTFAPIRGRYREMVETREMIPGGGSVLVAGSMVETGRSWPATRAGFKAAADANSEVNGRAVQPC